MKMVLLIIVVSNLCQKFLLIGVSQLNFHLFFSSFFYEAVVKPSTQHIVEMVKGQKTPCIKRKTPTYSQPLMRFQPKNVNGSPAPWSYAGGNVAVRKVTSCFHSKIVILLSTDSSFITDTIAFGCPASSTCLFQL